MGAQRAACQPRADRTAVLIALEFTSRVLRPEPWFLNDGGAGSANSAPTLRKLPSRLPAAVEARTQPFVTALVTI